MIAHRLAPAVALAIVIGTLALLTFMLLGPSRDGPNGEPAVPSRLSAAAFAELTSMGHWLGPRDAPVVAVVLFDYGCGFSVTNFSVMSKLRIRYPEHLALVLLQFVDPDYIGDAHLAVECAAEMGYFERMHRALMDDPEIQRYSRVVTLLGESAEIGDLDSLRFCVRSRRPEAALSAQWRHGQRLGVSGTPTLFINGVPLVGAAPEAVVDSMVASSLRR